jgi:hypothetical protein
VERIDTRLPDARARRLKTSKQLAALNDEDEDITVTSAAGHEWLEMYSNRPTSAGDSHYDWDSMCLAEFVSHFQRARKLKSGDGHDDVMGDDGQPASSRVQGLHGGAAPRYKLIKGGVIAERTRRVVVSTHPYIPIRNESAAGCYSNLLLFVPWRRETELVGDFPSIKDAWAAKSTTLPAALRAALDLQKVVEETNDELPPERAGGPKWLNLAPGHAHAHAVDLPPPAAPGGMTAVSNTARAHGVGAYRDGVLVYDKDTFNELAAFVNNLKRDKSSAEAERKAVWAERRKPGTTACATAWQEHAKKLEQIRENPEQLSIYNLMVAHMTEGRQFTGILCGPGGTGKSK